MARPGDWTPRWRSGKIALGYHQGVLMQKALRERKMAVPWEINHINGRSRVDDVEMSVIYPDSFFARTAVFVTQPKAVRFVFVGAVDNDRGRLVMDFASEHGLSVVRPKPIEKGEYDERYFAYLGASEFGLCPQHPRWGGPPETAWTYRFIECCMVGAIPIVMGRVPLGEEFTDGFRFVWDGEPVYEYDPEVARHNRALAEERWKLP